jgi:hypothetical protein
VNFESLHYLPLHARDNGSGLDWGAFSSVVCSRCALTQVINEPVDCSARDGSEAAWRTSVFIRSMAETDEFRVGMTWSLGWDGGVVADTLRPSGLGGGWMGYDLTPVSWRASGWLLRRRVACKASCFVDTVEIAGTFSEE